MNHTTRDDLMKAYMYSITLAPEVRLDIISKIRKIQDNLVAYSHKESLEWSEVQRAVDLAYYWHSAACAMSGIMIRTTEIPFLIWDQVLWLLNQALEGKNISEIQCLEFDIVKL